MPNENDSLFLLEVLVDKIVFAKSPCFSDKDFRTCVTVACSNVDPLEICDDDPGACVAKSGGPFVKTFNTGKSCLFSLKQSDIASAMAKFPVHISVHKSLPCGCLPTKIMMGEATIDMTKEFVQARNKYLEDPNCVSYQALKDSFRLMGSDQKEAGEIVMFLRISCFGKLIVTKFQGAGGQVTLGAAGHTGAHDRSCNPARDFQSFDEPCVCGVGRGPTRAGGSGQICKAGGRGAGGVCPPGVDPYYSTPCEEPDDPCYCTGPKQSRKPPMTCRNTDPYCLHVPKGALPSLLFCPELTEEPKEQFRTPSIKLKELYFERNSKALNQDQDMLINFIKMIKEGQRPPVYTNDSSTCSLVSLYYSLKFKKPSVKFSSFTDYYHIESLNIPSNKINEEFNQICNDVTVYNMTFCNPYRRTSGTQATASINKCFQVPFESSVPNSEWSSNESSVRNSGQRRCQEVYFFGRKWGMGSSKTRKLSDKPKARKQGADSPSPPRSPPHSPVSRNRPTTTVQMNTGSDRARNTPSTTSCVSSKGTGPPCAINAAGTKGDLVATISHIKIGPKEPCPVHGSSPCQGPKCKVAVSQQDQAPVKVTTVTNPRRGVFELVIRRLTGAPLARNELMLEWTPPPCRFPPCGPPPVTVACYPSGSCRPTKCKLVTCRPPTCKPKCCKKVCKKPCVQVPCGGIRCKKCCMPTCCGNPCIFKRCCGPLPRIKKTPKYPCNPCPTSPCNPCPTATCRKRASPCARCPPPSKKCPALPCKRCPKSPCRRCPTSPCKRCAPSPCKPCPDYILCSRCQMGACGSRKPCCNPCSPSPCCASSPCCSDMPCSSTPCLRPCPVGRKRIRRYCSYPRIRPHRKLISPCLNRSKKCPVARCRSLPAPCTLPCFACPPRDCCSGAPPCKPKCCKSHSFC